ncbi:MAG: hypothetical protein U0992_23505, partial [Planctomycetaceae bacterium]
MRFVAGGSGRLIAGLHGARADWIRFVRLHVRLRERQCLAAGVSLLSAERRQLCIELLREYGGLFGVRNQSDRFSGCGRNVVQLADQSRDAGGDFALGLDVQLIGRLVHFEDKPRLTGTTAGRRFQ